MGLSVARYAEDSGQRKAAMRFAETVGIAGRRPVERAALASEPAGDLAAAVAVTAVLTQDAAASAKVFSAANALMADAVSTRPGWGYHLYLLGRTDPQKGGARARRALGLAVSGAPGMDVIWSAYARAEVEAWPGLSAAERSEAPEIFRRAFRSEDFVTDALASVTTVLGRSRTLALLPEDADVLSAAAGVFAERADLPGTALLLGRADGAERREREEDLAELERRAGLSDVAGLSAGCRAWFDAAPSRGSRRRRGPQTGRATPRSLAGHPARFLVPGPTRPPGAVLSRGSHLGGVRPGSGAGHRVAQWSPRARAGARAPAGGQSPRRTGSGAFRRAVRLLRMEPLLRSTSPAGCFPPGSARRLGQR